MNSSSTRAPFLVQIHTTSTVTRSTVQSRSSQLTGHNLDMKTHRRRTSMAATCSPVPSYICSPEPIDCATCIEVLRELSSLLAPAVICPSGGSQENEVQRVYDQFYGHRASTDAAAKLEKLERGKLACRVARKQCPHLARKGRCCGGSVGGASTFDATLRLYGRIV